MLRFDPSTLRLRSEQARSGFCLLLFAYCILPIAYWFLPISLIFRQLGLHLINVGYNTTFEVI
jgi:hypothetical protein